MAKKFITIIFSDVSEPFDLIAKKYGKAAVEEVELMENNDEIENPLKQKKFGILLDWFKYQIKNYNW